MMMNNVMTGCGDQRDDTDDNDDLPNKLQFSLSEQWMDGWMVSEQGSHHNTS